MSSFTHIAVVSIEIVTAHLPPSISVSPSAGESGSAKYRLPFGATLDDALRRLADEGWEIVRDVSRKGIPLHTYLVKKG